MKNLNKALLLVGAISLGVGYIYLQSLGNTSKHSAHSVSDTSKHTVHLAKDTSKHSAHLAKDTSKHSVHLAKDTSKHSIQSTSDDNQHVKHKKKKKFVLRKKKTDLKKFCFEDNRSIHYKANERCKSNSSHKKKLVKQHKHSNH